MIMLLLSVIMSSVFIFQKVVKLDRRADTYSITSYESKALAVPGKLLYCYDAEMKHF